MVIDVRRRGPCWRQGRPARAARAKNSCRVTVDVVVTIAADGIGLLPDPDKFAAVARRAALSQASASQLVFAYTARKVITSMTLAGLPDESAAVSAALDVVSEAFRLAAPSWRRDWGAFDKPADEMPAGATISTGTIGPERR
jgi:hypothetical protein